MRIDGQAPPYIVEIKRTEQVQKSAAGAPVKDSAGTARPASQDRVVISPRMREIERLKQEMATIPEVRLDKVALAKQQMQQGVYRPDSAVVARKLVESMKLG
jgi:negative regulator of flagellin synthesis FlgM